MKKILIAVFVLVVSVNCFADESQKFYIDKSTDIKMVGSEQTINGYILAAGSEDYFIKDLNNLRPAGFASLQVEISGTGALRIYHESSNDGEHYNTATVNGSTSDDIVGSMLTGSELYVFDLPFARYLKVNFVESSGLNSVVITKATLAIQ